jgi:hypothetical protein
MQPIEDPTDPKKVAYYAPVRGLIDFNELSSLIGRATRMGSVMKPTLMQFYDMDDLVKSTSMTTGSKEAHEPFASTTTTTQPLALRDLLDMKDDHSGFLNRWVFVPGNEKVRSSMYSVRADISPAIKPLQEVHAWASTFKTDEHVTMSPEAFKLWDEFFHTVLEPDRKSSTNNMLVRMDLTMKKLILLFAVNRKEKIVSEQSVRDAIHMHSYLKAAYGIPSAHIGTSRQNEISEVVLRQVEKYTASQGGITIGQMWRNIKHRKYDRKEIMDTLTVLTKMGFITEEAVNEKRVGRPTVRYKHVS